MCVSAWLWTVQLFHTFVLNGRNKNEKLDHTQDRWKREVFLFLLSFAHFLPTSFPTSFPLQYWDEKKNEFNIVDRQTRNVNDEKIERSFLHFVDSVSSLNTDSLWLHFSLSWSSRKIFLSLSCLGVIFLRFVNLYFLVSLQMPVYSSIYSSLSIWRVLSLFLPSFLAPFFFLFSLNK